jgi:homoserine O-acetyltransferase/O-succinyltransferase
MIREETLAIGDLELDCGMHLAAVEQHATVYGRPLPDGSNVVLIAHALTGSSRAAEWWPGIVGTDALFDTRQWCVIGINALGSCFGSTGPTAMASDGAPYGARFPRVTVGDMVRAQARALRALGVERLAVVIGGSLGGMQALQWALEAPDRVGTAVIVGAHDHHSAMGIALNAVQREALANDPRRGLRLARKIAMLTYKSDELLTLRHDRRPDRHGRDCFDVEGYLEHQADLIEARMDATSYGILTHAMDSFDVRDRRLATAHREERHPELFFVGLTSDWLFRPQDVRAAARRLALRGASASYLQLQSSHGHDGFLADHAALRELLQPHLSRFRPQLLACPR